MTYAILDLETTIRASFKRKANPFDSMNWVVAVGSQKYGQPVQGLYFTDQPMSAACNPHWFIGILAGIKTLVGFNIKFDILHAIQHPAAYEAWKKFIANGGTIWDCQLAEYLLDGMHQASHMLPLDEVAPRYGGDVKDDEVKTMWEAGIDTPNIPKDLLMRYLCGTPDHLGDIDNTRIIFLGQAKRAKEAKQIASIMLNMGSLVYTIEAEFRGMYVNKEKGLAMAEELHKEMTSKYNELMTHLPPELPFEFNLNSRFHMSAWLFGGSVKYQSRAYTWDDHPPVFMDEYADDCGYPLIRYAQKDELHYLMTDGSTCPQDRVNDRIIAAVQAGTPVGIDSFKSGKNAGQMKTKKVKVDDITKPKTRMEDRLYKFPGITKPDPKWKSADGQTYSTAGEIIDILVKRDQPFLRVFGDYTSLKKDLGTYFITTDEEGKQKGMLTLVMPDGLVHHKLNHTSTVTGRFSSSDPNLQNLPKGDKSRVKELFESRFGGGSIIQSDFTALEVYVQAVLTNCKNLIADLKAGIDMHCMRLSIKEKMPYEEVYHLCRVAKVPEWDMKRTKAKVFSFQRAYGAGAQKIADSTGMDIEEVKALIAAEEERYPEIAEYYEELAEIIAATAKDVGDWGSHPDFPKASINLRRGFCRTPDNKLYSYKEAPAPKFVVERQGIFTSFSPTEVKNYVVQGTGAEWAKAAMWLAIRLWYWCDNFHGQSYLINQVHDALYADSQEAVAVESAAALHACMNMANKVIERLFGYAIPVHVPSETKLGPTMAEEKSPEDMEHFEARVKYYEALLPTLFTI